MKQNILTNVGGIVLFYANYKAHYCQSAMKPLPSSFCQRSRATRILVRLAVCGLLLFAGLSAISAEVESDTTPSVLAHAESARLTVIADDWQDYSGRDGRGLYFDVINEVFAGQGVALEYVHQPIRRAIELLKRKEADAVLGVWHHRHSDKQGEYLTGGLPLDVEIVTAVFPRESDWNWRRLRSETHARYAWVQGYDYSSALEIPRQARVPGSINGLRMLQQNHIDGFIDDQFYLQKVLRRSPEFSLSDYRFESILIRNMYVAFRNDSDGQKWLAIYQKNMQRLLQQGRLHQLFNKWQLDYELVKYRNPEDY